MISFPWIELSLATSSIGAICVPFSRNFIATSRWCIGFATLTLVFTIVAAAGYFSGSQAAYGVLSIDEFNAPILPLVALIHLLIALATARTKMGRFSFGWLLAGNAVQLGAFSCLAPGLSIALLIVDAMIPLLDLNRRGRPTRLYAFHAIGFAVLLCSGWMFVHFTHSVSIGSVLLVAAALVRVGAVPAQVWMTEEFETGSFGVALLFTVPMAGIYTAVRFVLPVAPDWAIDAMGMVALVTACYAAAMGIGQTNTRRLFAYLVVSHSALVLVGIGLLTSFSVTGALVMWLSASLSLTGLGLTLRAVEARVGVLNLTEFRGLYDQSPMIAIGFLITGMAAVGFPGTSGFVAIELLVDEAVGSHLIVGIVVVLAAALNGISVVRAYLLIFTGRRYTTGVALGITIRERIAVLTLVAMILVGGLIPQSYVESRHRAADDAIRNRGGTNLTLLPQPGRPLAGKKPC